MNERITRRAEALGQPDGSAVAGVLESVLLGESGGSGATRPGDVSGSSQVTDGSHAGYDCYLHSNVWHARRVLKNGSVVCGLGYDKQEAIEDLEANWGGQ